MGLNHTTSRIVGTAVLITAPVAVIAFAWIHATLPLAVAGIITAGLVARLIASPAPALKPEQAEAPTETDEAPADPADPASAHAYLGALHEITLELLDNASLEALFGRIAKSASALLDTEDVYIYEIQGDELVVRTGLGAHQPFIGFCLRRGEGVAGQVWATGEAVYVDDYDAWPLRKSDFPRGVLRASIGVPLKIAGNVRGVLGITTKREDRRFGPLEREALERFAAIAALALTRHQLEESLRQERDFAREVIEAAGQGLTVIDLHERVEYANPAITRLLGLEPQAMAGQPISRFIMFDEHQRIQNQVTKRQLGEISSNEWRLRHVDGHEIEALITGAPRVHNGQYVGTITVITDLSESKRAERALRDSEARYKDLYAVSERRARDLTLIDQVRHAVDAKLEPDALIRQIVETTAQVCGYQLVSVYLLEDDHLVLQHQVGYTQVISRLSISRGVMGRTARTGRSALVTDPKNDPDVVWAMQGLFQEVCVPLLDRGRVIGVFNVESTGTPELGEDDLHLLEAIAERVSSALTVSRLYDEARSRERQYRTVLESLREAVVYVNPRGVIEYVNPSWHEITGIPDADVVGQRYTQALDTHALAALDSIRQELTSGVIRPVELRRALPNGKEAILELAGRTIPDGLGGVAGYVFRLTNITERRRAEHLLAQSERRLQALIEHSADVTYVIDPKGIIKYASPNVAELGFDPEFWKHTPVNVFEYLGNPSETSRGQQAFKLLLGDPTQVLSLESQIVLPDGSLRWFRIRAKNRLSDPAVSGIVMNVYDITDRKRVELELRESEERYALAVQGASDGIWDWNLETDTVYLSSRWKDMLGYDDALPSSRETWLDLMHPEDHTRFHQELELHLQKQRPNFSLEYRLRHHDGSYRWVLCRGVAIHDAAGRATRIAGSHTDITDRGAYYDALTGLPSRLLFEDRLRRAMERHRRDPDYRFAVLFMDMDRFKVINDSLGHLIGDQLLIGVARRLEVNLGAEDTAARLGGDEFVVLLEHQRSSDEVRRTAAAIAHDLSQPFDLGGRETFSGVSIGIVTSQSDCDTAEDYLRAADTAMYRAKSQGTGIAEYDTAMHTAALERMELETALRRALANRELRLVYQPIIELATGRIASLEALIRWQHPTIGPIGPDKFIPIAEEIGLIHEIGEWVLRTACAQLARWRREQPQANLGMNINVSGVQLARSGFAETVGTILETSALPPDRVRLEITESSLMAGSDQALEAMFALQALGVRLQIDDFGTGYSSLGYLQRLPVDTLKIDRSFVHGIKANHDPRLVGMIVTLAKTMGLNVVSEGVELYEQALHLAQLGCEYAQGYYFSRPLEASALREVLNGQFPVKAAVN